MMAAAAAAAAASEDSTSVWHHEPLGPPAYWFYQVAVGAKGLGGLPGRGEWRRFCRADSAALEARYSGSPEAFDATWARQWPADGAAAPAAAPAVGAAPRDEAGETPVLVRSGLFEVCVPSRTMWPVFWEGSARQRVLRCTWQCQRWSHWEALGAPLTALLEIAWRSGAWRERAVQPGAAAITAARVELAAEGLPSGLHALFVSDSECYLVQDNLQSKLSHAVGLDGGVKGAPGLRLRRGWEGDDAAPLHDDEADDERAAVMPPTHLVLVTHGIGHRLEFVDVASDAAAFRKAARALTAQHVPPGAGRLVALPVQWRKAGDLRAERALDAITPDAPALLPVRQVLNMLALDVLSYWTPQAAAMTDALAAALNAQYARFLARHPTFSGTVSVAAHSLGSVLAWDILCCQPPEGPSDASPFFFGGTSSSSDYATSECVEEWSPGMGGDPRIFQLRAELAAAKRELAAAKGGRGECVLRPLAFRVDTLMMIGSPLALFLALQETEGTAERPVGDGIALKQLPACRRVVNLHHPHDPVSYRLEPLLAPAAAPPRSSLVPWHRNNGRRLGVELADRLEAVGSSMRGLGAISAAAFAKMGLAVKQDTQPRYAASNEPSPDDAPRALLRRLAGAPRDASDEEARVDYQLQAAEIDVPIVQAFTAHLSYWSDPDVALFMLRACGPAPDVPALPAAVPGSRSCV
jgi:hypothetical protein